MTIWHYIIIGVAAVALVFLLRMEMRRMNRARSSLRMMATVLGILSLVGLRMPLSCHHTMQVKRENQARERAVTPESGCLSVDWERQVMEGARWQMQGQFSNTTGQAVRLELRGMGVLLDSATMKDPAGYFTLTTQPAQIGRALYQLLALSGKDTLEQEWVPLEVLQGKPLRVLLLAGTPGFENRALANWLSDQGHAVAVRTTIGKNKFDKAYLHMPVVPLDVLSPGLLDHFDVVIVDTSSSKDLGRSGWSLLRRQVSDKGLGVVVRDSTGKRELLGAGGKIIYVRNEPGLSDILSGKGSVYARQWSDILQSALSADVRQDDWEMSPALPRVDEPVKVTLRTGRQEWPQGAITEPVTARDRRSTEAGTVTGGRMVTVYMDQHPWLPFYWAGDYWPSAAGWHSVCAPEGDTSWWYVWKKDDWKVLREKQRAESGDEDGSDKALQPGREPVNNDERRQESMTGESREPMIQECCYLVFLLCMIFLWVERKL